MKRTWRFRSTSTFFGLTTEYIKDIYEVIFLLKYYGGWSFTEVYNLPIGLRKWFFERLVKEKEKENPKKKNTSKTE